MNLSKFLWLGAGTASMAQIPTLPLVEVRAKSALESVVDSVPQPGARGLHERIAALPSMRVDHEGRLQWRGTNEFRIDFDGIPLDRAQLEAFPAGISADIETDPQADARQNSAGLTGWIHLSPKLLRQKSYVEGSLGGSTAQRQWSGVQGAWLGSAAKIWGQYHQQARAEKREEHWQGTGLNRQLQWKDRDLRQFGLAGISLGNSWVQAEVEAWSNQAQLTKVYSRSAVQASNLSFDQDQAITAGTARLGVQWGMWNWRSTVDLLQSLNHAELDLGELREKRRYVKGLSEIGLQAGFWDLHLGAERRWDARNYENSPLWQDIQNALYVQSSSKWSSHVRAELGLRFEGTQRLSADASYDQKEWVPLPSAGVYYELPWWDMEAYGRYSYRVEYPDPALLIPGKRKIAPYEGRIGDSSLLPELIHGTEFGLGIPVPQYQGKLEIKAFSALADQMLLRKWSWVADTAYLQIENGLSENRRGGEISWTQNWDRATLHVDAGSWIEDREVVGPKSEIFGGSAKVSYQRRLDHHLDLNGSVAWTGPAFDAEGEADPYFEQSVSLGWKPWPALRLEMGAESLLGTDRTLTQTNAQGQKWSRTRTDPPRFWMGLNWGI